MFSYFIQWAWQFLQLFILMITLSPWEVIQAGLHVLWRVPLSLWALSCFLPQLHIWGSLFQLWSHSFLQRSLVLFSGKWYLEANIRVLGVLIAIAMLLLPRPLKWTELGSLCVYMHIHHVYIHRLLYTYMCCVNQSSPEKQNQEKIDR